MRVSLFLSAIVATVFIFTSELSAADGHDITDSGLYFFGFTCAPSAEAEQYHSSFNEKPIATGTSKYIGVGRELGKTVLWLAPDGNWSVTVMFPDVTCSIINGTDWQGSQEAMIQEPAVK